MNEPTLKIAVIGSRSLPGNYGGVETACENLYTRLIEKGIKVLAYCRSEDYSVKMENYKGVDVFNFPVPNISGLSTFLHCFIASILATFSDAKIIHYHAQGPALFSIIPKIFAPSKKIGFTCHGQDWQRARWNWLARRILKMGEKFSALNTDFRIMVSNDLKKYYQTIYGVNSICLYNGVTSAENVELKALSEKFGLEKDKYLLFVGRLVPEKAPHILIQAFNQITTSVKLVIVGDSPETQDYVNELKELAKGNSNIIFTSYIRGREKAEAYSNALAYVSSSTLEGHPITVLEAMAYSLPILISDIPPHREILSFYSKNYLPSFKNNDVEDCRRALSEVCLMPLPQLKEIGGQSKAVVSRVFDWEVNVEATKHLYLYTLDSKKGYKQNMITMDVEQMVEMPL